MKKNLMIRLLVLASSTIFFSSSYSQLSAEKSLEKSTSSSKTLATGKDADKMALASLKAVNAKMFEHFSKNFKAATDISVQAVDECTHISFRDNGIKSLVQYNKKGKWSYTTRNYAESLLPDALRDEIEQSYPGFRVFGFVTEVKVHDKEAKLIMIENRTSWKRIRIVDDNMDVYESYTKPAN